MKEIKEEKETRKERRKWRGKDEVNQQIKGVTGERRCGREGRKEGDEA